LPLCRSPIHFRLIKKQVMGGGYMRHDELSINY